MGVPKVPFLGDISLRAHIYACGGVMHGTKDSMRRYLCDGR